MWARFSLWLILLMLVIVVFLTSLKPVWQSFRSANWPGVPCTILESHSEVLHSRRKMIPHYRFAVSYRYEFAGLEYRSSRHTFFSGRASAAATHDLVLRFPSGTNATCFVNPKDPGEAVLDPGIQFRSLLLPGSFLLGVALLLMIYWLNRRAKTVVGGMPSTAN